MENRTEIIQEHLNKIRQFNLTVELVQEVESFLENSKLTENEIDTVCRLMERAISQHYVKQLLKGELIR